MASAVAADLERARGAVSLAVAHKAGRHAVADLGQSGCARLLFPAIAAGTPLEAVIVNTAGGLTGGDRFSTSVTLGPGARSLVTTQACERIYRSAGATAEVTTTLHAEAGANLAWLPQETILFDRARLSRRLAIDMAEDATVLAMEAMLLGRKASGESLTEGLFSDSWRLRRGGRLVYADETALAGDLAARIGAAASLSGTCAYATLLLASPQAAERLDAARDLLTNEAIEGGVSTFDGLCVARLVAQDGATLRRVLVPLLAALGTALPRVWHN